LGHQSAPIASRAPQFSSTQPAEGGDVLLRHRPASLLAEAGADSGCTMSQIGHKSAKLTVEDEMETAEVAEETT
jgi:hypothetical protein